MPTVTASTLRPLSSVLGFDIIEMWASVEGNLTCQHYFHSEAVQAVVRKVFPDSVPFHPSSSPTWQQNSRQVGTLV